MDYVDLWLVHWPPRGGAGSQVWKQLLVLRDEGMARAVGVSNYSTAQLDELVRATGETPEVNQIRWGPTLYDPSKLEDHRRRGVILEGYSPFKTTDLRDPVLVEVAAAHGVTAAQVVVRWHIDHGVVVIFRSRLHRSESPRAVRRTPPVALRAVCHTSVTKDVTALMAARASGAFLLCTALTVLVVDFAMGWWLTAILVAWGAYWLVRARGGDGLPQPALDR